MSKGIEKYDVFISYSRKDYIDDNKNVIKGNVVSRIKQEFAAAGISYWFDEEGINHGDEFAKEIVRNIRNARVFIFVSTKNSNASEWTSREIASAHMMKKRIIPVRVDDSPYNEDVMFYISILDFIDYKANPDKGVNDLVKSVKSYLEAEHEAEVQKQQKEEERRRKEERQQARQKRMEELMEEIECMELECNDLEQSVLLKQHDFEVTRAKLRSKRDNLDNLKSRLSNLKYGDDESGGGEEQLPHEKYSVYINGESTPNIISSPNEPFTAQRPETSELFGASLTFTLSEVLKCHPEPLMKDGNSVKIDLQNRRVDVSLNRKSRGNNNNQNRNRCNCKISLKILGTKHRQSGFNAILVTGAVGLDKEFDRRPIISSSPAYIVKHTVINSLYQLIDCNVKQLGAKTNGMLTIVIAIPAGTRMADNRSPYSLLMEIYAHFRRNYMTKHDDGRYEFRDIDMTEQTQEFRDILDSYPLEEYPMPRTVMNGDRIGTLSVSPALIEDFFRDCNYPEMAVFKDVEIGFDCETSPELAMLEIPRREKFTVYVNGEATPNIISTLNEPFTAKKEATPEFHESSITFTLSDILRVYPTPLSKDGNIVKIDMPNHRIDVNLTRKSKGVSYTFGMIFSGNNFSKELAKEFKQYMEDGVVKVFLGNIDITEMLLKKQGKLQNRLTPDDIRGIRIENNSGIKCSVTAKLESPRVMVTFRSDSSKATPQRPGYTYIFPPTPMENKLTAEVNKTNTLKQKIQQHSKELVWEIIIVIAVLFVGMVIGAILI